MATPLNVLIVEDSTEDTLLLVNELSRLGYELKWTRVEKEGDFRAELKSGLNLIFSDFTLPQFSTSRALEIFLESKLDIPFIVVSGTIGEERVVEILKAGATDYVLKNRFNRLALVVKRALRECEERSGRKRLELQFIEAQKMEVVGHLASGVAHDFNNILSVIIGYSDLMMPELGAQNLPRKCAEEIRDAAERAAGLTRQLLLFSRKQALQPVVLNLNEIVESMDKMLRRLVDENVELAIQLDKDIGRIKADSGQVGQLLMNLVVNARDAMPNGGKLAIETASVTQNEDYVGSHSEKTAGDYVTLSVRDTGTGMGEAVKARLFEAFFTTKPKGKGTGLGLATCHTIVKQCSGHIEVKSELGKGSVFKIYFPRVDQPLEVISQPAHDRPSTHGTETLLLVEDEPSVRNLACNILEAQGYHVLRASNGQEGLRIVTEHQGEPIRLAITDVIMPQMSGTVMAEWLKTTYPNLKILFTSGYTDDAIIQHGVLEPGVAFLPKPYTPAALSNKVRELLDEENDETAVRP